MRKNRDFFTRLGERLGLPREGLPGGFSAFFSGGNEVTVRGCRKILRYESEIIVLSVGKKKEISVLGRELICTAFNAETVTVTGDITALTLGETGKNDAHGARTGGDHTDGTRASRSGEIQARGGSGNGKNAAPHGVREGGKGAAQ